MITQVISRNTRTDRHSISGQNPATYNIAGDGDGDGNSAMAAAGPADPMTCAMFRLRYEQKRRAKCVARTYTSHVVQGEASALHRAECCARLDVWARRTIASLWKRKSGSCGAALSSCPGEPYAKAISAKVDTAVAHKSEQYEQFINHGVHASVDRLRSELEKAQKELSAKPR